VPEAYRTRVHHCFLLRAASILAAAACGAALVWLRPYRSAWLRSVVCPHGFVHTVNSPTAVLLARHCAAVSADRPPASSSPAAPAPGAQA